MLTDTEKGEKLSKQSFQVIAVDMERWKQMMNWKKHTELYYTTLFCDLA